MKTLSAVNFGSDVSLYRQGSDILHTDDTFHVGRNSSTTNFALHVEFVGGTPPVTALHQAIRATHVRTYATDEPAAAYLTGVATFIEKAGAGLAPNSWLVGMNPNVRVSGGSMGTVYSLIAQRSHTGGAATTSTGVNVEAVSVSGGATIGNAIGVDIGAQRATGVTNAHGVYQRGTADYNYFAGNTGLGVTAPTLSRLQFPAGTTATDGITWGTDTNLYRSAAGQLRTPGAFRVGTPIVGIHPASEMGIAGPYKDRFTWSNLSIISTDAQAVDKGGSILLGGSYTDAADAAPWARIAGGKTNSVSGEYGGYLSLATRPHGGNLTERIRIAETGQVDLNKNEAQNLVTHKLAAAPASPVTGQRYYDTALRAERVYDGTAWSTLADVTHVATSAPTGTPNVGDLWYDTDQATVGPGEELAYNQITANVILSSNSVTAPNLVIEGTSRTYDGSPVMVEFWASVVQCPSGNAAAAILNLWDGATDLGVIGEVWNGAINLSLGVTVHGRRRLVPTAGTHNYRVLGYSNLGSGTLYAGVGGGGGAQSPAFIRVIRA